MSSTEKIGCFGGSDNNAFCPDKKKLCRLRKIQRYLRDRQKLSHCETERVGSLVNKGNFHIEQNPSMYEN